MKYLLIILTITLSNSCVAQKFSNLISEMEKLEKIEAYSNALEVGAKAWKMAKSDKIKQIILIAKIADITYQSTSEYERVDSLTTFGISLCGQKEQKLKTKSSYVQLLITNALANSNLGNTDKTERSLAKAFEHCEKKSYSEALCFSAKGFIFYSNNNYPEALKYLEISKSIFLNNNVENLALIEVLVLRGRILSGIGEKKKAKVVLEQALSITEKICSVKSQIKSVVINQLGILMKEEGNISKALEYLKVSNQMSRDHNEYDYLIGLKNIAIIYLLETNEIDSTIHYINQFKSCTKGLKDSMFLVKSHINTLELDVLFSHFCGDYENAILYSTNLIDFLEKEKLIDKNLEKYIDALNNISSVYYMQKNFDEGIKYVEKALIFQKKSNMTDNEVTLLGNISYGLSGKKEYKKSLAIHEKVIALSESIYGKTSNTHKRYLAEQGVDLFRIGKYKEAIDLIEDALKTTNRLFGDKNYRSTVYLGNLIAVSRITKNEEETKTLLSQLHHSLAAIFVQSLPLLNERTKIKFVKKYDNASFIFSTALDAPQSPELSSIAYDHALLTKGIVSAYTQAWKQQLENTKDKQLKTLYDNWLENKQYISKQYEVEIVQRNSKIDSIAAHTENLESQLSQQSAAFRTANEQVNWQQIQATLGEKEAAIEFIHFQYHNGFDRTDSVMYAAMILKKGLISPILVPLFEEKTLDKMLPDSLDKQKKTYSYFPNENYEMIWQPLEPFLKDIEHIYYAPSGKLELISFDALAYKERQYLTQRYNTFRRLRSTRELHFGLTNNDLQVKNALCLSDVVYDENNKNITSAMKESEKPTCGFAYLGETGQRNFAVLDSLTDFYKVKNLNQKQANANESYWKKTVGKETGAPDALLFYTHGFYQEKPTFSVRCALLGIKEPLFRSGLILANGNAAWCSNGQNISSKEDNILTAYEIANMDLSDTKLVILAACQSGKGDLQGSEGIIGLQRSFKIAGAKNLLVALRDVDATYANFFITRFYQKILTGQSPHKAYHSTLQEAIESDQFGPNVWSAFVLVE